MLKAMSRDSVRRKCGRPDKGLGLLVSAHQDSERHKCSDSEEHTYTGRNRIQLSSAVITSISFDVAVGEKSTLQ